MIGNRAIFLALISISLLGCWDAEKRNAEGLQFSMDDSRYYVCKERCESLNIRISVKNDSDVAYCVPDMLLSERVAESIEILSSDGNTYGQLESSGVPSEAVAAGGARYVRALYEGANYIILPKSSREFDIYTGNKFDFPNVKSNLNINMIYYPCFPENLNNIPLKSVVLTYGIKPV